MYAKIIPIRRLTVELQVFDYKIPTELESIVSKNQLVLISFHKQVIRGIIVELTEEKPRISKRIIPIIDVCKPEMIFPQTFIDILWETCRYYHVSPALLLHTILPQFPKRYASKPLVSRYTSSHRISIALKKDRILFVQKAFHSMISAQNPVIFQYQLSSELYALLIKLSQHYIQQNKTVIIIAPFISDAQHIFHILQTHIQKARLALFHKQYQKNTYYQLFRDILRQQYNIIIGTKVSVFAPLQNIACVIVLQEDSIDLKQYDQNPRYDARHIAKNLTHIHQASLIFASRFPRTQSIYYVQQKQYEYISLPYIKKDHTLVDLRQERRISNHSLLSFILYEKIQEQLQEGKNIFLWLNRKGLDKIVTCADCHMVYECPSCHVPLSQNRPSYITCPKCEFTQELSLSCGQCQGSRLQFLGTGTKKMQQILQTKFPKSHVLRVDKESDMKTLVLYPKNNIIIGTDFALKNVWQTISSQLGLIAILELPHVSSTLDYRFQEKYCEKIAHIISLSIEAKSQLLIQTHHPQDPLLEMVLTGMLHSFYDQELLIRKETQYPPFTHLIKIICKDASLSDQNAHIHYLQEELTKINKNDIIKILGVQELSASKTQKKVAFLFKTKQWPLPLPRLPASYQLDVDYESI